jgi:glycosyltransferase involved in cell wall biosynthesis
MAHDLSILMPVFNERATVEAAIDDALTAELPVTSRELIVVDDGSTDGTRELLGSRTWPDNVRVVFHTENQGKGAAVRTGLTHASCEFAAVLDADLEYRAADLAEVLRPLVSGDAKVVFGTRAWTSQSSFSFWYVMGNKVVTFANNLLYNCWISDDMTCHKAMSTEQLKSLRLRGRGFAIEPKSLRACSSLARGSTRCRSRTARGSVTPGRSSRPWTGCECCARSYAAA